MKKLQYKWIALSVVTLGSLMVAIDSTIVILALPAMLQDLHSDLVRMTWVITSYLLISTVLLLSFGRMADMFGRVRLYNLGFLVFTIGSVLCGLAPNDLFLIAARVLQGAGGAMLNANAMAIITEVFPPGERGTAMGFNSITWGAGSVLGPVLGGLILSLASWRWIFLVNLPVGLIGMLAAYFLLHEIAPRQQREPFDILGALLFCIGLVGLLFGLLEGISVGWRSPLIVALLLIGLMALLAFLWRERHYTFPMLNLQLFSNRLYAFSILAAMLQSLAVFAVNFLVIFYLQGVRGYPPLVAALLILPLPLCISLVGPLGGRWADRIGGAIPATIGLVIQALALVLLGLLTPTTPYWQLALILALMGIGGSFFWSPNTSTAMSAAPRSHLSVASATLNTLRNVGMIFSFAVALDVAAVSMPPALVASVFLGTVGHLAPTMAQAFTAAMDHAFLASALICVLAVACSLVRAGKGPQLTGLAGAPLQPTASERQE
ncbi:MFS transporter [Thermogemmatispora carboxidivorans]|uniref:MFS transporter n=1 Tax=Thermogemmatispora carboxidivorans TaxID=1382306 RepID=UPI00069B7BBB|nr:MFS transporter [Thermogemmatispora carboxidivorans]